MKGDEEIIPFTPMTIEPFLEYWLKEVGTQRRCRITAYDERGVLVGDEPVSYKALQARFVFAISGDAAGSFKLWDVASQSRDPNQTQLPSGSSLEPKTDEAQTTQPRAADP